MKRFLNAADILLPDFSKVDGTKWASVACDQFTAEPEYWHRAYEFAKGVPSTLELMLPEAFLDESAERIPVVNRKMKDYLSDVLVEHKNSMIYLEREQSDGRIRRGIIGCVDLELYDYSKGSNSPIRATEGTVLERIPPRVEVRRGAVLELPHIMILIDDPEKTVIEECARSAEDYPVAYDFDLMAGGGHVKGRFIDEKEIDRINLALEKLATPEAMTEKYSVDKAPLLFAIGDGNHSLASAKALYEEIKSQIGDDAARVHPARYALCEIVNLHDEALEFEPIYRVVYGVDPEAFVEDMKNYASNAAPSDIPAQRIEYMYGDRTGEMTFENPDSQLTVGTVQNFLDRYMKTHKGVVIDYIHGLEAVKNLSASEGRVGITFGGMQKNELFKTVICDGALPRKTFSMGHAEDKRYYLECRKIR